MEATDLPNVHCTRFVTPALRYDEATLAQVEQIQKEVRPYDIDSACQLFLAYPVLMVTIYTVMPWQLLFNGVGGSVFRTRWRARGVVLS